MFSLFFINRPIFAKVVSILIMLVGLIALLVLPVEEYPEIAPPSVTVSANYTGGSASVVAESVTKPLEKQINGVEGMIYMDSTSGSDGSSNINIYFKSGYDLDIAAVDIQNRVAVAMPTLPESVKINGVKTVKKSSSMIQILTVSSDNDMHDALFLSNFAGINVIEELKQVDGVSDVMNFGEKKYSMRIWLEPNKLSTLKLTIPEVANAIRAQNVQAALGTIGSPPMASSNMFQYTVTAKTRLSTATEFENIIVKQNSDGSQIKLKDVARVELGAENYGWYAKFNDKPSALLGISQIPGSNSLEVANGVTEKIEELSSRFPEGLEIKPTYDTTTFIKLSIEEVMYTLIEALILVLIVVFFFLQSFRATIIPAVAIPVSLIGTFAILLSLGFSINILTLFGLILAIGIVVDDAIIVVENVEANLERNPNMTPLDASIQAMKEVSTPIISTTSVLMAVFVPVTFIPGISGTLYQQFASTIAFSVFISAIVALTLSPALAVTVLKRRSNKDKNILFKKFDDGLNGFKVYYKKMLFFIIKKWYIFIAIFMGLLYSTYFIFSVLPVGFVPDEDKGNLIASVILQPGTSLEANEKISREISSIITETKGVADILEIGAYNLISGVVDTSATTMFIVLDDWSEREEPELEITALLTTLKNKLSHIEEANIMIMGIPSIPGISAVGGFEYKLRNLQSTSLREFEEVTNKFIAELNKDERIMYAYTTFNSNYPQFYLDIDREKIYKLNIDIGDVFTVLQTYLGSMYVNDFNKFGNVYRVYLQADQAFREKKNDISSFYVKNKKDEMVPLSAFVKIERQSGPSVITHFNSLQSISINGLHNIQGGFSSTDAITAMEELSDKFLSEKEYSYEWAGMALQEKEAGNAAAYVFALSLIFVFLFLSAQYESWIMPLMIMIPIPVVFLGALGANMFAGLMNNTYTQIGLILLIGMSCKNAILIIEFAKDLREQGSSIVDSAINASLLRLRAILMTIFAFLLGILPLVFATGPGAAARQSLGTAVFGGMLASTVLTLFFTPLLFVLLQRLRERNSKEVINENK
ncbi:MAG: efflux RND transporter permease subunit [Sulfurospirillum sp.]|nr:efflux RND transporter permease subunit [Sulfurospirillum sp.]MBL0703744.1 efflux RND transporter permease subunit [Sulfurospirillum sp.]